MGWCGGVVWWCGVVWWWCGVVVWLNWSHNLQFRVLSAYPAEKNNNTYLICNTHLTEKPSNGDRQNKMIISIIKHINRIKRQFKINPITVIMGDFNINNYYDLPKNSQKLFDTNKFIYHGQSDTINIYNLLKKENYKSIQSIAKKNDLSFITSWNSSNIDYLGSNNKFKIIGVLPPISVDGNMIVSDHTIPFGCI